MKNGQEALWTVEIYPYLSVCFPQLQELVLCVCVWGGGGGGGINLSTLDGRDLSLSFSVFSSAPRVVWFVCVCGGGGGGGEGRVQK